MYQFYARFVKGYAELFQLLHDFSTQCPPRRLFSWNEGLVSCFQAIKEALTNATLLAFPDPDAQTELITDASGTTIGCVLQQRKEGTLTPLAFWSKGPTKAQLHWSTFERELFTCYASLKHFRYYLEVKDFTLCTDHRPIVTKFYSTTRVTSPRQERFFDFISHMINKLKHVSGKENVADILSRPADPPLLNSILPNSAGIDYFKMAEEQQSDLDLQNLKQNTTSLLLKDVPLGETGATLLCDDSQGRLRPLVSKSMRRAVFQHFHSSSHPGIKSGTKSIDRLMVWRDMRKDIRQWTKECQVCARSKVNRRNTLNVEAVTPRPRGRFTHVYIDIISPLGLSKGHNYVLSVIDRFLQFF